MSEAESELTAECSTQEQLDIVPDAALLPLFWTQEIERYAPRRSKRKRAALFDDLDKTLPNDAFQCVLKTIRTALGLYGAGKRAMGSAQYRREVAKVRKLIAKLAAHPLMATGLAGVLVYRREHYQCPHGRVRKRCENLGHKVAQLEAKALGRYTRRRHAELVNELRKVRIDAATAKSADFCAWSPEMTVEPERALSSKPGRRNDSRREYVVGTLMLVLLDANVEQDTACGYVARILADCFGDPATSGAVKKCWSRLPAALRDGGPVAVETESP